MTGGIIAVNKPEGFTSFDVVAVIRKLFNHEKTGHAGTLDPMATGVLPVCIGRATKAADILPHDKKEYIAGLKFGAETDTYDRTGKITKQYEKKINKSGILEILPKFTGEIYQYPPMYSAVSVNGKRLYDLARMGREVERPKRKVYVEGIEILDFDENAQTAEMKFCVQKGTYIRSLAYDIGRELSCGAYLTSLCRTKCCNIDIKDCRTLEQIKAAAENGKVNDIILPTEKFFEDLPKLRLSKWLTHLYTNGVKLTCEEAGIENIPNRTYCVYSDKGIFIGTCKTDESGENIVHGKTFALL